MGKKPRHCNYCHTSSILKKLNYIHMRCLVGDKNIHLCLGNLLSVEKELLKSDPSIQLAQEIYTQLQKRQVHSTEAAIFSQYLLERILDHKNPKTDLYDLSYMPLDRTLVRVPAQISQISNTTCENLESGIEEFLKLSKYVTAYRDFDGNRFSELRADSVRHIEYIRGLDQDRYIVLLLQYASNVGWEKYKSDAMKSSQIRCIITNGKTPDIPTIIEEFVAYEKEFKINLHDFMRFLQDKHPRGQLRAYREDRAQPGLCSDRKV